MQEKAISKVLSLKLKEAEEIINNNPFVFYEDYSFEILSKNSISLGNTYH